MFRSHVMVCGGTGCTSSGSKTLQEAFTSNLEKFGLTEEIKLVQTGCFGLCALGPIVIVYPDGTFYSRVTPEDVETIVEIYEAGKEKVTYIHMTADKARDVVEKHLKGGNVVTEYTVSDEN